MLVQLESYYSSICLISTSVYDNIKKKAEVNIMLRNISIVMLMFVFLLLGFKQCIFNDEKLESHSISTQQDNLKGTSFEKLEIPESYDIRQFEGMTLKFIVENNLYANILSYENEEFYKVTGINVNIRAMDFDTLAQKVNLDFVSKAGEYQVVYVDPYKTLSRFYADLEVLNSYNEHPKLPKIQGYTEDFFDFQTQVCSYFNESKNLYTVPFDSTTMILYYRKDIFDKYKDDFFEDMGYDWTPGTKDFTWGRYREAAAWIDKNVPDDEVKYGSGHMAQKHNSIFCDFSNVLAAYGGDYFSDENVKTLGIESFNSINVLDENFVQALEMYKQIIKVSAPESVNWNWTDNANAFRNGEIALMPNWDENYTYIQSDPDSKVNGKVGFAILPYGDKQSANIYGGSGIGINKYASDQEKQAAWLYIVWATSKNMQMKMLNHPQGGTMPTRKSPYEDPTVQSYLKNGDLSGENNVSLKLMSVVLNAWEEDHQYLRPKISNFYEVEQVLITNLNEMVAYDLDSTEISKKIYSELAKVKANK